MCGIYTQQDVLEVVGKKQTCVGKNTVNLYFFEVAKTKHVWLFSNTYQIQGVWKKDTHVCKNQTYVSLAVQDSSIGDLVTHSLTH